MFFPPQLGPVIHDDADQLYSLLQCLQREKSLGINAICWGLNFSLLIAKPNIPIDLEDIVCSKIDIRPCNLQIVLTPYKFVSTPPLVTVGGLCVCVWCSQIYRYITMSLTMKFYLTFDIFCLSCISVSVFLCPFPPEQVGQVLYLFPSEGVRGMWFGLGGSKSKVSEDVVVVIGQLFRIALPSKKQSLQTFIKQISLWSRYIYLCQDGRPSQNE